jgi:predicted dehydrogenase
MSFLSKKISKLTSRSTSTHSDSVPTPAVSNPASTAEEAPSSPPQNAPRVLVIGAGSRGHAYASAIKNSNLAHIVGVCEPIAFKRQEFGAQYIWGPQKRSPLPHEEFEDWSDFLAYETDRRARMKAGELEEGNKEYNGVDGVFVCVLDEMHVHVIKGLAPLGLHVMCEKPLATSLADCLGIYGAVSKEWEVLGKKTIFGICHVLRYSPHNMFLHKLVREDKVVGDVISVEHTEPVGWWHFEHSYVRGNWRRESATAPSLLTKSCHDIDFLLWMLCSPLTNSTEAKEPPHLPTSVTSTGSLNIYRKARKPVAAGTATNCISCPIEPTCKHSAKSRYVDKHFEMKDLGWPVKIVVPEIEDLWEKQGKTIAREKLLDVLKEDYNEDTADHKLKAKPWFGRCVFESDNDVCDDQVVTMTWKDDPLPGDTKTENRQYGGLNGRGAKTALFHMIAPTEKICERRGRIYGTEGEITYDSTTISVYNFTTGYTKIHKPKQMGGGHGGGDDGLANNFVSAVQAVKNGMGAEEAQRIHLGCDLEEVVRSHIAVFMADSARKGNRVVEWEKFWENEVDGRLNGK